MKITPKDLTSIELAVLMSVYYHNGSLLMRMAEIDRFRRAMLSLIEKGLVEKDADVYDIRSLTKEGTQLADAARAEGRIVAGL